MFSFDGSIPYTPYADICTISLCIICIILMRSSYISKKATSQIFVLCNFLLMAVSTVRVAEYLIETYQICNNDHLFYVIYNVSYIILILLLVLFNVYLRLLLNMEAKSARISKMILWISFTFFVFLIIAYPIYHVGYKKEYGRAVFLSNCISVFMYAYIFYGILILLTLLVYKNRFITKMNIAFLSTMVLSLSVVLIQLYHGNCSYTCITYSFPIIASMFMFHYNSYDPDTGTLDAKAFDSYVKDMGRRDFTCIYLYLKHMYIHKMDELALDFFHFNEKYFREPITFRLRDEKLVMIYKDDLNKDAKEKMQVLLRDFKQLYEKYQIDYKIVIIHSNADLHSGDDYLTYDLYLEKSMQINSIHMEKENDIKSFLRYKDILNELYDIYVKKDLNDERVLVYCQPVYSNKTHKFSTAEALMRLKLPEIGLVFPDQFIPIAEEFEYIHEMSKIILNKTCQQIKKILDDGKRITRVSVNFNIEELLIPEFVSEIKTIIAANDIPFDKIAIELTEGQNEKEFDSIKAVMHELGELGIKFYLDDFGTSYSNFERIMELPFDIIKFDRSMTIMAAKGGNAEKIVGTMSSIFADTNFRILFEGIENEADENRCIGMGAQFLQGYKYSKPIPMEQLVEFL